MPSPAARVAFNPNDNLGFLVGIFSSDPAGDCPNNELPQQCNPYGLLFPFTPPLLISEMIVEYNQGNGELMGKLKLGAWRDFGTFDAASVGGAGLPISLTRIPGVAPDKNYGFYAILDQMLYRVPGKGDPRGIWLFSSYMTAPAEGNLIENYFEFGFAANGLLDARPHDVFSVGLLYSGVSSQVIDYYQDQGFPVVPSFEAVLEATYLIEVVEGFNLQPDFQYYWNPGGHVGDPDNPAIATPNAAVIGMRTTINY